MTTLNLHIRVIDFTIGIIIISAVLIKLHLTPNLNNNWITAVESLLHWSGVEYYSIRGP